METRKKWITIPIIGALVVAIALGVMAFTPSYAANFQGQEVPPDESLLWKGGSRGHGRGDRFGFGTSFDYDTFIAEELGVSVADLQAARQAAHEAALEQAVAEGVVTAEQAELIKARQALTQYIDKEEMLATALGITTAELEAARQEGKSLPYFLGELGLDPADIKDAMQSAHEDAVQQAVDDGVITDSQAEQLQEYGFGSRGSGMRGGGIHGQGGPPFQKPALNNDNDL